MLRKLIFVAMFTAVTVFAQTNRIDTRTRNDSTYVAKTGDEAISGVKQFTNGIKLPGFLPNDCLTVDNDAKVIPIACGGLGIPGVVSDGANGVNVGGSVAAKTVGGARIASQWQTGGGNNGITNAQVDSATVIADPGYALTEKPGMTSFTASPFHYQNQRGGWTDDFYRNPQTTAATSLFFPAHSYLDFVGRNVGDNQYCLFDVDMYNSGNPSLGCKNIGTYSITPGSNRGNPIGTPSQGQNWIIQQNATFSFKSRTKGIREGIISELDCKAQGDCANIYAYTYSHGGWTDASGEAVKSYSGNTFESTAQYTGTCSGAGCTNGSQAIKLSVANGEQAPGHYIINTTAGPRSTGTYSAAVASAYGTAVTVSATQPVSTAWGAITGTLNNTAQAVNTPTQNTPPFTTSMTFNVTLGVSPASPGPFVAGQLICFGGTFHEQAIPTAVGTPSGGIQSITVPLRQPHAAGTGIMQGGACGQGIELTAYTFNGMRYLWDVIGSTDANTLQVTGFQATSPNGQLTGILTGLLASTALTTATNSVGPTVYVTVSGANGSLGGNNGTTTNLAGLTASSPGDSPMNGVCTNVFWSDSTHFTCTRAGLTGTNTTTSTGTASANLNNFQTWAMAEVTDVRNNTLNPPQADGTMALEPNIMTINPGDSLTELNGTAGKFQAMFNSVSVANPYAFTYGIGTTFIGRGFQGGGGVATSNAALYFSNGNDNSFYSGFGGVQSAPNVLNYQGAYHTGFLFNVAPAPGGTLLRVLGNSTQYNDPTYNVTYLDIATKPASWSKKVNLFYGDVTEVVPRINTIGGILNFSSTQMPAFTSVGGITFAPMTTPTLTVTPQTSGGNLADGTYCYRIQARGGSLYSAQSADVCNTLAGGSNKGSMLLTWTAVTNAITAYYIFGRTGGATAQMSTTSGIGATRFTDNGSITPGGGASASSQPGIDDAGYVGIKSSGTTTGTKIQSASGTGGNTVTLPSATGTLALLASPTFTGTPAAPTPVASDNSTTIATTAFARSLALVAAMTTTASASDNVTVTGMTASGHCQLTPTNASAATNIATTYVSAKTTNQITVTHTATASMTYDVFCTPY